MDVSPRWDERYHSAIAALRTDSPSSTRSGALGRVAVGFVLTLLLLEAVVRVGESGLPAPQRWSTPETQYKVGQIGDLDDIDTVIVGSSIVDVSIDASVLGPGTYNAALGAAPVSMYAAFTDLVVVPELDPDTVVVGVASRELNANAPEQRRLEADFFDAAAMKELQGTEGILDTADRVASDVSALVRNRVVLRDPGRWFAGADADWDGTITADDGLYLGFLDGDYRADDQLLNGLRRGALHDWELGEREVAILRGLLTDLVAADRRVVLLVTPVTADYVSVYPNGPGQHEVFLDAVRDLAAETGVELLEAGIWGPEDMADPLHTNGAGTDRLTAMVAAHLGR